MLKFFVLTVFLIVKGDCEKIKNGVAHAPNIIFLLTDDHRWDALGANDNKTIQTPNLDKLARQGLNFKNAYVTTSICMVSRASILSGQYMSTHGINNFITGFSKDALQNTYPAILKKHGYRTGFIGKFGVGNPADQPKDLFDYWKGTPLHQPNYENEDEKGDYFHYTDFISGKIENFLKQDNGKPFLLSVSFKSPHSQDGDPRQFIPNSRYAGLYENISIPVPQTASPEFWEALPEFFHCEENIARERWYLRFDTPEKYQESVKNYYRLITGVDDAVGELVKQLKEKGLANNTIIIFMGDNGMYLGEHGLAGKWFGHQESIRVPLIIFDPRKEIFQRENQVQKIALNIDIAPTILGYAGIEPPSEMQGFDLKKILTGEVQREEFLYEHTFMGSPYLPKVEGVVSPEFKYLIFIEHNYEQLYDLINDPHEENNLAATPEYIEILKNRRELYKILKTEAKK